MSRRWLLFVEGGDFSLSGSACLGFRAKVKKQDLSLAGGNRALFVPVLTEMTSLAGAGRLAVLEVWVAL